MFLCCLYTNVYPISNIKKIEIRKFLSNKKEEFQLILEIIILENKIKAGHFKTRSQVMRVNLKKINNKIRTYKKKNTKYINTNECNLITAYI